MNLKLEVLHFPVTPYCEALAIQKRFHQETLEGVHGAGVILTFQHPPTLTLGKNSSSNFILLAKEKLLQMGTEIVDTDRGGEVTGHEPGQLVVYPILHLAKLGLGVKEYVKLLESAVVTFLNDNFSIQATTDSERPGVWVGQKKICALGVRVAKRVTLHGLALNVTNSLEVFNSIVPCGLKGYGVTSIANETNLGKKREIEIDGVKILLIEELIRRLKL